MVRNIIFPTYEWFIDFKAKHCLAFSLNTTKRLKMKLERIFEALKPNEERDVMKRMDSGHSWYRNKFLEQHPKALTAFRGHADTKQWTTRFKNVELKNISGRPDSSVLVFLEDHGYKVSTEDYIKGVARYVTKVGNPDRGIPLRDKEITIKIGKALDEKKASAEIIKKYENDPFRSSVKKNEFDIIVTGNPYDIYGGSTGRGWTSCMQMRKGEMGHAGPASLTMSEEINNHTHMVYLVPPGGDIDHDAIARVSFKLHNSLNSDHSTLVAEDRVYGTAPTEFIHKAKEIMDSLFDGIKPDECYQKDGSVYNDNGKSVIVPDKMSPEDLETAFKNLKKTKQATFDNVRAQLAARVEPDVKYKAKILKDCGNALTLIVRAGEAKSFNDAIDTFNAGVGKIPESMSLVQTIWVSYHNGNTLVEQAMNKIAEKFDFYDGSQVLKLMGLKMGMSSLKHQLASIVFKNIKKPKNMDELMAVWKLQANFGKTNETIEIAEDHEFGEHPLKTAVSYLTTHNMMDYPSLEKVYVQLSKFDTFRGNLYDLIFELESQKAYGISHVVKYLIDKLKNYMPSGIASLYGNCKEETCHKISDLMPDNLTYDAIRESEKEIFDKNRQHRKNRLGE